jgi:hypothetical protein
VKRPRRRKLRRKVAKDESHRWEVARQDAWLRELLNDSSESETGWGGLHKIRGIWEVDSRDDRNQGQAVLRARGEHGGRDPPAGDDDVARGVFRTMGSRNHDVVVVGHTINLDYWEFGMGRG